MNAPRGQVCVGVVAGAHGVQGALKVRAFTAAPGDIAAYGPVSDEEGTRSFRLTLLSVKGDIAVVKAAGVAGRNAAEALRGIRLYVPRERLPGAEAEEFYHADLIGLRVELPDGAPLGTVRAVYDFGAGDVLEVARKGRGGAVVVPFTREMVPVIDLPGGRLVVEPVPGLLEPVPGAPEAAR